MSDEVDNSGRSDRPKALRNVLRVVRDASADRTDAAAELHDTRRMRLEVLAEELKPVFAQVPDDDPQFDFVLSSGLHPRLWIDATAHVAMGRDGRTYRFLRDSRLGRSVIDETADVADMADAVTRHIAERMVERQRMLDGPLTPASSRSTRKPTSRPRSGGRPLAMWGEYVSGFLLVVFGAIAGIAILIMILSDLVPELGI